ncbi:MAG: helix-turn-helix transcriptional regulator [Planctomycetes bacterium]|nr:helix-turn-helix transcriptional regulator [Planctomycetota bacterium]
MNMIDYRKKYKLSQTDMLKPFGLSRSTVSRIERHQKDGTHRHQTKKYYELMRLSNIVKTLKSETIIKQDN